VVYTYTSADGAVYVFRELGSLDCAGTSRCAYVSSVTYPEGTKLSFEYETQATSGDKTRLRSVVSNRGFAMLLQYGANGGGWHNISSACLINLTLTTMPSDNNCPTTPLRQVGYSYTTYGGKVRLASFTNAAGATESFTYAPDGTGATLMGFIRPGASTPWLTNTLFGGSTDDGASYDAVGYQSFADGRWYSYDYFDSSNYTEGTMTGLRGGVYNDALGSTTVEYGYFQWPRALYDPPPDPLSPPPINFGEGRWQVTSGPSKIIDHLGQETTFDYCDPAMTAGLPTAPEGRCVVTALQSYTDPEGRKTVLSYDAARNLSRARQITKPGMGEADVESVATYACTTTNSCNNLATIREPNSVGSGTAYYLVNNTYSSTHGGILTSTSAAVDGVSAVKRYSYVQRSAWLKNAGGTYSASSDSVWLLSEERTCKTTATASGLCAGGSADEVVLAYDYGPDSGPNLLFLRGTTMTTDGVTLRTCFAYDDVGNKIAETTPGADLTTCN
jgi:hypothetical protein